MCAAYDLLCRNVGGLSASERASVDARVVCPRWFQCGNYRTPAAAPWLEHIQAMDGGQQSTMNIRAYSRHVVVDGAVDQYIAQTRSGICLVLTIERLNMCHQVARESP